MKNKFKFDGWFIVFIASVVINIFIIIESCLDLKNISNYGYFDGKVFNLVGFVLGVIIIPIFFISLYKIYKIKKSSVLWVHIFFILFILRHSIGIYSEGSSFVLLMLWPFFIVLYFSIVNVWIRLIKYLKENNEKQLI